MILNEEYENTEREFKYINRKMKDELLAEITRLVNEFDLDKSEAYALVQSATSMALSHTRKFLGL